MEQFTKVTDETIMPFGRHKNKRIEEVPASYLIWLEGQLIQNKKEGKNKYYRGFTNGLLIYIEENRDGLNQEIQEQKNY